MADETDDAAENPLTLGAAVEGIFSAITELLTPSH